MASPTPEEKQARLALRRIRRAMPWVAKAILRELAAAYSRGKSEDPCCFTVVGHCRHEFEGSSVRSQREAKHGR